MMEPLLDITHLEISVANKVICRDLNLTIMPGQCWGIVGPNGSGKTTFLHTLAGLHPAKGNIKLLGKDITSLSQKILAKKIGLLTQTTEDHFPQTVYELCSLGRFPHLNFFSVETAIDKKITLQALSDMKLFDICQQKVQTLSGGERKRLSIATLLTQTPELFLLDEPMNHLDFYYQVKILNHFKKLAKQDKKSIIMSLHDINLAWYFCDNVLMLYPHEKFFMGPTKTILNEQNLLVAFKHPIKKTKRWSPTFEDEIDC